MVEAKAKNYLFVLDDDPMIAKLLQQMTGMNAVPFRNPVKMAEKIRDFRPKIIFVDIFLDDGFNGLDYISDIKRQYPNAKVFVITSSADEELIGNAFAAGADDYITKPLRPTDVRSRIMARTKDQPSGEKTKQFGHCVFSPNEKCLMWEGKTIALTPNSSKMLETLLDASDPSDFVPIERVKLSVWGNMKVSANQFDKCVSELRKELKVPFGKNIIKRSYGAGLRIKREDLC